MYKILRNLSLGVIVGTTLSACNSSSNDQDDIALTNCISFPKPQLGQTFQLESKNFGQSPTTILNNTIITAMDVTSITTKSNVVGDASGEVRTKNMFSIANNFKDTTQKRVQTNLGNDVIDSTISNYSPFSRMAVNEVCENQTWISNYQASVVSFTATEDPVTTTAAKDFIYTIESINEQRTVQAGTFTTYRQKQEAGDFITTNWYDTVSGTLVSQEKRDNDGTLLSSQELTELNVDSPNIFIEVAQLKSLEQQLPSFAGFDFRGRKITIKPNASFNEHSHATRPGIVYVISGELVETRNGVARTFKSGDTWLEDADTVHSVINESIQTATIWMVDLPQPN